jgi:hypothetical protein
VKISSKSIYDLKLCCNNEPDGRKCNPQYICKVNLDIVRVYIQVCFANILWVAFSTVPSGLLSVMKYSVYYIQTYYLSSFNKTYLYFRLLWFLFSFTLLSDHYF